MDRRDMEQRRRVGYMGASGRVRQFEFDGPDDGRMGGNVQTFGDDAKYKHAPRAEHYNNDHFGQGTRDRGWHKNLDNYPHHEYSHFGKGPLNYLRSSDKIKEEVNEALTIDRVVDASEIEVDVEEGIVTLTGTVKSRKMKKAAERAIEGIPGIEDVINMLGTEGEGRP